MRDPKGIAGSGISLDSSRGFRSFRFPPGSAAAPEISVGRRKNSPGAVEVQELPELFPRLSKGKARDGTRAGVGPLFQRLGIHQVWEWRSQLRETGILGIPLEWDEGRNGDPSSAGEFLEFHRQPGSAFPALSNLGIINQGQLTLSSLSCFLAPRKSLGRAGIPG